MLNGNRETLPQPIYILSRHAQRNLSLLITRTGSSGFENFPPPARRTRWRTVGFWTRRGHHQANWSLHQKNRTGNHKSVLSLSFELIVRFAATYRFMHHSWWQCCQHCLLPSRRYCHCAKSDTRKMLFWSQAERAEANGSGCGVHMAERRYFFSNSFDSSLS